MPHQPTRLPYGLSFLKPGERTAMKTLASSQTPSVEMGTYFVTASSAITITNFTYGEEGKIILLFSNSGGATTIQNSAGGINVFSTVTTISANQLTYSTTGSYIMANNEVMFFVHNGTDWSQIGASVRVDA